MPRKLFSGIAIASSIFLLGIIVGVVLSAAFPSVLPPAPGETPAGLPVLYTEEQMINDLRKESIDLKDIHAVFGYVFSRLPDSVKVYPTENYYYFQFYSDGQHVWGNIRLEYGSRDEGKVSFAYFGSIAKPEAPADLDYTTAAKMMDALDGVLLQKEGPLTYVMTYEGKKVTFHLNDISQAMPKSLVLEKGEKFFGHAFDESGFQFFLLYDTVRSQFRFVLDREAPLPDVLEEISPTLFIGRLSSFAFYKVGDRLTLVAAYTDNIRRNNYYDGPFDQLPDNFVEGPELREAMEEAYPYLRSRINDHGSFVGSDGKPLSSRLALTPYMNYTSRQELLSFLSYCERRTPASEALLCLTHDYKQDTPAAAAEQALGSSASSH